jgi:uncharacterized protein involved in type VI secretion and phage assembly
MSSLLDLLAFDTQQQDREAGRIHGVVTGIVADLRDPDNLGRVKVLFPWLAEQREDTVHIEGQEDRAHSYWARMATLMAGKQRGTFFVPDPGDEVLVAFEHGQVDRPVIIGMLWNKDDAPPTAMDGDGKNNLRVIHSRSGHKIVLDDSDDKPSILIVDKTGNNKIFIDSTNKSMEIAVDQDLTITVGGKLSITAKMGITMESNMDVGVKAKTGMNLESNAAFSAKGSTSASVEGSVNAELKGAMVSINGSGITEVKGGLVKIN